MTAIAPNSKKYKVLMTDHVNELYLQEGFDLAEKEFRLDLAGDIRGIYRGYVKHQGKWRGPYQLEKEDLEVME